MVWSDFVPIRPWNCTDEHGSPIMYPNYGAIQSRAFIAAGVASILYFVWEGGPCHSTRLAEMYYLFACVTIMTAALVLQSHREGEGRASVAYDLNRLLAVMVAMRIYASVVSLRPLTPFYAFDDTRPFARREAPSDDTSFMAHRIATELQGHLQSMMTPRDKGLLSPLVFPVLLLPLVFLEQEVLVYFGVAQIFYWPAKVAAPLVFLTWAILEIPRICMRISVLSKVRSLLANLLEYGDAALVREVYRRLSMASFLQATNYEVHELLVEKALSQGLLDPLAKAVLINGLQKYGVSRRRKDYVLDLIQSCKTTELTELKSHLDSTGDYNSLYKLVYVDIKDPRSRDQVLSHIQTEACLTRRHNKQAVGLKVLSDIDDTLLCSGGSFPAGCDDRIPKHMVYPGCGELFQALDRSWSPTIPSCNLVFLSARPHVYKDLAENKSFHKFRELFSTGRLHSVPTLLPGSLALGVAAAAKALFVAAQGWGDVGQRKAESYMRFKALYEEYDFMFFGDNGQGDLLAGQIIRQKELEELDAGHSGSESSSSSQDSQTWLPRSCRRREQPRPRCPWAGAQLRAVMIHEVLEGEKSLGLEPLKDRPPHWRHQLEEHGIYFFSCYPAAALRIHELDAELLPVRKLRKVAEAAIADFDHARVLYPEWSEDWGPTEHLLKDAIQRIGFVTAAANEPLQCTLEATRAFLEHACQEKRRSILLGLRKTGRVRSHLTMRTQAANLGSDSSDEEEQASPVDLPPTAMGRVPSADQNQYPPVMTRIGSAWRELQAIGSDDAL